MAIERLDCPLDMSKYDCNIIELSQISLILMALGTERKNSIDQ